MFILSIFIIFFLGLYIGSFITAISMRISNEEKVFIKRSKCDNCGKIISYIYLIPVLGYLLCRGLCRFCQKKVSLEYTFWELLHATLYIILYLLSKENLAIFLVFAFVTSVLIMMTIIDIKTQYVYDLHIVLLAFGIFLLLFVTKNLHIGYKSFIFGSIPLLFKFLYEWLRFKVSREKIEVIGMGDIKIFTILFFFLDFYILLKIVVLSGLFGASYGLLLNKKNIHYAFLPAISLALYIILIYNFI
jgi:leader peptidase (prepilin peptidase)/N-methyltransferase